MYHSDLKDVTLEKASQYIVEPLEFSYKIEGKTVYVSKPRLETKMFSINYLALKKIGKKLGRWKHRGDARRNYKQYSRHIVFILSYIGR